MHRDEIEQTFDSEVNAKPAMLHGFKRHYGQRSEWRTNNDGEKGSVLTVAPCYKNSEYNETYSCNGIILYNIKDSFYDKYKERERGYELVTVKSSSFSKFEDTDSELNLDNRIIVPIGGVHMYEFRPLVSYMDVCVEGAKSFGEEFYKKFCNTTYETIQSDTKPHLNSDNTSKT